MEDDMRLVGLSGSFHLLAVPRNVDAPHRDSTTAFLLHRTARVDAQAKAHTTLSRLIWPLGAC